MDQNTLNNAVEAGRASAQEYAGLHYHRLLEAVDGHPRGSVVLPGGRVLPGYPSIARIQSLEAGLHRQFVAPFRAEEKIDGFNVRILREGDAVYAFSRGGFVCPFATDRVPDFVDTTIFEAEPDLILCAEIAGPDTPYLEGSSAQVERDVELFVFDMMRRDRPGFLPHAEREALERAHRLPHAQRHGRFSPQDVDALRELVLKLDARSVEGLVLKEEDGDRRAKYVTGRSCINDIRVCGNQLLDLPPEYFTHRLMRLAIFLTEHARTGDPEIERELGRAFLEGVGDAVQSGRETGHVGHPYRCRFRARANAERFIQHMRATGGRHVRIDPASPQPETGEREGYWRVDLERRFDRMTGTLASALRGDSQFD
ncbi:MULTISPECIES: RNA ligase [unclassified Thioalkalivibrio]|uniref:RNA ligase n=1 Tax=unclassified Thioalkalivibrio TaxID=2621013 RepID=UPI00036828CD|nr:MULTISPECIES: RNA ligase [unclassified Thioalkalivibrio]